MATRPVLPTRGKFSVHRSAKIAYHEAGHVFALLHFGIPFQAVYLAADDGTITLSDGTVKDDANGTVETLHSVFDWIGPEHKDNYLSTILAGMCASKIMMPGLTYVQIANRGTAYSDWLQARLVVEWKRNIDAISRAHADGRANGTLWMNDDEMNDFTIFRTLPDVRRLVKKNWDTIVKIGDALIESAHGQLTYDECRQHANRRQSNI